MLLMMLIEEKGQGVVVSRHAHEGWKASAYTMRPQLPIKDTHPIHIEIFIIIFYQLEVIISLQKDCTTSEKE